MNFKECEGFTGCTTISEVIDRYLIYIEMGVELAVLDWSMYAYINDYLADELWERLSCALSLNIEEM